MPQCSDCSQEVLPIVCVDVDGTISEYHYSLAEHCRRYFGIPYELDGSWDGRGNFEDFIGITQEQYREAKLAYRQGGFKRWSPVQEGVEDLLFKIRDIKMKRGLEVWITTTRPWNRLDSVDPDTQFWLNNHFPVWDHILYDENKYTRLASMIDPVRVVGVIDDLPPMVAQAAWHYDRKGVWMVDRDHNRSAHPSVPKCTLEEFAWTLEERVEEWWT